MTALTALVQAVGEGRILNILKNTSFETPCRSRKTPVDIGHNKYCRPRFYCAVFLCIGALLSYDCVHSVPEFLLGWICRYVLFYSFYLLIFLTVWNIHILWLDKRFCNYLCVHSVQSIKSFYQQLLLIVARNKDHTVSTWLGRMKRRPGECENVVTHFQKVNCTHIFWLDGVRHALLAICPSLLTLYLSIYYVKNNRFIHIINKISI